MIAIVQLKPFYLFFYLLFFLFLPNPSRSAIFYKFGIKKPNYTQSNRHRCEKYIDFLPKNKGLKLLVSKDKQEKIFLLFNPIRFRAMLYKHLS